MCQSDMERNTLTLKPGPNPNTNTDPNLAMSDCCTQAKPVPLISSINDN